MFIGKCQQDEKKQKQKLEKKYKTLLIKLKK